MNISEKELLKGTYKVKLQKGFMIDISFFSNFYLPVLGTNCYSLYYFLFSEVTNNFASNVFLPFDRLSNFLKLDNKALIDAFWYLQFLNLLFIYFDKNNNRFLLILNEPRNFKDFNIDFKLKELLISKIGNENYKLNYKLFAFKYFEDDQKFKLQKLDYKFVNEDNNPTQWNQNIIKFNFNSLFKILEENEINYLKFWNKKFEDTLSEMIVLYNLSIIDIVNILKFLINNHVKINIKEFQNTCKNKFNFNINLLKQQEESEKLTIENKKKLMAFTEPEKYIKLVFERKARSKERELIHLLLNKYQFNYFMVNGLIDYSRIINEGRISKNYILKIAESLYEEEIVDDEEFLNALKEKYNYRKTQEKTLEFKKIFFKENKEKSSRNLVDKNEENDILKYWKEEEEKWQK